MLILGQLGPKIMHKTFSNRSRLRLISLIFLGLSVRVLTPAGYMPASLAEGGPFVLCPGGLSGAVYFLPPDRAADGDYEALGQTSGLHHGAHAQSLLVDFGVQDQGMHGGHGDHGPSAQGDDQHGGHEASIWEFCPFGAVFGSSGLTADVAPADLLDASRYLADISNDVFTSLTVRTYRARAPPQAKPLST